MALKHQLDDHGWNRLQDLAERFEQDCADAFPRNIQDYLPSADDPLRDVILDELLRVDLEIRWRRGKGKHVEEYLAEFPELERDPRRLLELIEEEHRVRHAFGDRPTASEFIKRFPGHEADLTKRLAEPTPGEFKTMESAIEIPFAGGGNLQKVRRIGEGGFGEVWECRAPGGVPVAVKRIYATVSPKIVEREKQSLDLICSGKFRHPFLLQVFGWWVQENQIHIVMELADESLDDRLKLARAAGRAGLDLDDDLAQVVHDAGEALDFLNLKCRILHRDVKPANMLLMGGRLKLCDFGLARMTQNLGMGTGKTLGAGTPVFIAPEVVQGYQSMQSDQYSLAASYCMLRTGRPLFRGTVKEIRDQHVHAKPALANEIFSDQEKIVLQKALAKEPNERYATSTQFVNELLAVAKREPAPMLAKLVPESNKPTVAESLTPKLTPRDQTVSSVSGFIPVKRTQAGRIAADPTPISHPKLELPDTSARTQLPWWAWVLIVLVIFALGLVLGRLLFPTPA